MKRKKRGFFVTFTMVILCIALFFVGGYFLLDKLVVPKYFGEYGISNMKDLVGMMKTLYTSPNESKLVKNGFSPIDTTNAEEKLKNVFPVLENSENLDYTAISEGKTKEGIEVPLTLEFSDKEIAGVIDKMLELGILAKKLPNLEYINTIGINVLELTITPEMQNNVINPNSANVHALFKVDTIALRDQMANEMGISKFLIEMIIPDIMYMSVDYNLSLVNNLWTYSDGNISLNGRTAEQSEILLNMLISFIFPKQDNMNLEKLTNEFGNILQSGLGLLGKPSYKQNGLIIVVE